MPQLVGVEQRIPHPEYNPPSSYHDIALLRLVRDAVMSGYVRPSCLHTEKTLVPKRSDDNNDPDIASVPTATGWGDTSFSKEPATLLKNIQLR